jgi:hypothetical protein
MKYTKPSITRLGFASELIQGQFNKTANQIDAHGSTMQQSTGSAYDLDE